DKHRQMIGSLENERVTLERKVEQLRAFEREYRSRLKAYLESQLRDLEGRGSEAPSGGPGGQQGGQQGGPRSPFAPGAPVGGPDGPPHQAEQARTGFVLDEGSDRRG
ncbi:MAG TPA: cell division protein DivIVA, partial [Candidatus Eisenbacteria bacterium]|nr:cell division protein DivIVA [Candidatus Eisenbacteria bacterium]